MSSGTKLFHWADYLVFAVMLILSTFIGVFYAVKDRKRKSAEDFLMAGRRMNLIPVSFSLAASFTSAATVLGVPAEIYMSGTMFAWNGLALFFAIFGATQIYLPVFYKLRLPSVYEYINLRFSRGMRFVGSALLIFNMLVYMSIVVYAPSLAFSAVTGFSLWGSIVAALGACTLYTALGGMKAVLWTDSLQIGIMFAGLLAMLIKGSQLLGGFGNAWDVAESGERLRFLEAVWLSLVNMWAIIYICCMIGIVMYAYYVKCDPLTDGRVFSQDQLIPLMVMDVLGDYPGIPGLFLACVFSASISSVSSGLNALVTIILEDFLKTSCLKNISERREVWISKALTLLIGAVSLGLCWVVSKLGPVMSINYSITGLIGGPQLGLFTLGIIFPWSNKWGAYSGFFTSLVFVFWIAIGKFIHKPATIPLDPPLSCLNINITDVHSPHLFNSTDKHNTAPTMDPLIDLYQVSYMWYGPIAATICVIVGLAVSFLTGYSRPSNVDPRLICPLFDVLCPCLPERLRKFLWFGVKHDEISRCEEQVKSKVTMESYSARTDESDNGYENAMEMNTR